MVGANYSKYHCYHLNMACYEEALNQNIIVSNHDINHPQQFINARMTISASLSFQFEGPFLFNFVTIFTTTNSKVTIDFMTCGHYYNYCRGCLSFTFKG